MAETVSLRKNGGLSGSFTRYLLYAIGEIALVVFGILIALQINNWNEWRKERITEKIVLEDLRDNIVRNNKLIETTCKQFDKIDKSYLIVKRVIETKEPFSDTLRSHFSYVIRHGGFLLRLNLDGYESLKNTGFGIIQNENLKDRLLSLFEVTYTNYEIDLHWANSVYNGLYGWWDSYFYTIEDDLFIPIDYNRILNDLAFLSKIHETEEVRASLRKSIDKCYDQNQSILHFINDELGL